MNKACLHVDLDGLEHIIRLHNSPTNIPSNKCLMDFFISGVENSLILFEKYNVKATYFLIASDLANNKKSEVVKTIINKGHYIGSHSFYHNKLNCLNKNEKEHEIIFSKKKIEDKLGIEVKGFRAPSFLLDKESISLINEAGYYYDSSLFSNQATKYSKNRYILYEGLYELFLPRLASPLPPFHASYTYFLSPLYLELSLSFYRKHPLVYLFHLTDFSEQISRHEKINFIIRLAANTSRKSASKLEHCSKLLNIIKKNYEIIPSLNIIDELKERG